MLDRDEVSRHVAARLPQVWGRAAAIDDLQARIIEVLRDPRNGDLPTQLDTLAVLFAPARHLSEQEWTAWAAYAFGRPLPLPLSFAFDLSVLAGSG